MKSDTNKQVQRGGILILNKYAFSGLTIFCMPWKCVNLSSIDKNRVYMFIVKPLLRENEIAS